MPCPASPKPRTLLIAITMLAWFFLSADPGKAHSSSLAALSNSPTPENTVILAEAAAARFSQDFSPLLKQLRLPWFILDSGVVPVAVEDKNVILLGPLAAAHSGALMRQLLTEEEMQKLGDAGKPIVLTKESPWTAGRTITICTGSDLLQARDAAEQAIRALIASRPPASAWIQTTFDVSPDDDTRALVEQLRFTWSDEELPLADLLLDTTARTRRQISAAEAAADVERLFNLLAHGYAGYAFFNEQGEFSQAKARTLEELSRRASWSTAALSSLLRQQLSFITDCHLRIGEQQFAEHSDFWYDTTLELTLGSAGYSFQRGGARFSLLSINGEDPEPLLFPSLNAEGAPIYRLGMLAEEPPPPLSLLAADAAQQRAFEISLHRSDYEYYAEEVFREDNLGGIPVIRVRSFADVWTEDLSRFVESGRRLRGEPVVVIDVRGNGGGNEAWPSGWLQGLTGRRAEAVFISSELHSKTTMAGRANLFSHLAEAYPDISNYSAERRQYAGSAAALESGLRQPGWTGPSYPAVPLLANETTLIIVLNGLVASAGEGLLLRASQAENVILVGENSMGCLTFGNISNHQLPYSRLTLQFPINFNLFSDGQFREGTGLEPDLWVPAADAVNYAVAAVRRGTISTQQPLSAPILQEPFVPENPSARTQRQQIILVLAITLLTAMGSVWAYFMRQRPRILTAGGAFWLTLGTVWLLRERPVGIAFLLVGAICLLAGATLLFSVRRSPEKRSG